MASFVCFSNSEEKTTDSYQDLIYRIKRSVEKEFGDVSNSFSSASFAYYTARKGKIKHFYKDFIYQLRKAELNVVCIMSVNLSYNLKKYVTLLEKTELRDHPHSNAYYGEIKKIITSFLNFFTHIIDDVVIKEDKYKDILHKDFFLMLINKAIAMYEENQAVFISEFLPIKSPKEQEMYNEIKEKYGIYMESIRNMRDNWDGMAKQGIIEEFAANQYDTALKQTNALCNFTHTYMSMMLADRLYKIAVSVEETVERCRTNMRDYDEQCDEKLNTLIQNLYDKNKESLYLYRHVKSGSVDTAEINRSIEMIKSKIQSYGNEETIARLWLETRHWMKTLKDFNEIAAVVMKLHNELDQVEADEKKSTILRSSESPTDKSVGFESMSENIGKKKIYLEEKLVEASRPLITFFCVRGTDRILYTDNTGSYYCDEFNHQNYITDYGLKFFHITCFGDFVENLETEPYYFDEYGRYILVNGEKVHQCAPCTSQYKLMEDGLFKKITKDCGHSEKVNDKCRLEMKDMTDAVLLPRADIIDISRTLDSETANYLWDSFGMILPDVLVDVASAMLKNPVHYLAHVLLKRRFEATDEELKLMKKKADKYRTHIYKERREKAAAVSRAWKSKLVKRRKPEESDDTLDWAAYNQQVADWQYVNSLGYYE